MKTPGALALACSLVASAAGHETVAAADDTIKHPGDHPKYSVEVEPHALWGWTHYDYALNDGLGLGARFSIPIVDNGFISSINNNVAIGFGLDWLHYSGGCYAYNYGGRYGGPCYDVGDANLVFIPVVMQWNFFVAQHWSVFGEPGLVIYHGWFDYCAGAPPGFNNCANPSSTGVDFAFYAGGRYHFNDHVALVLRIGYPTFSFGVSFM
jgi:hypothetical protein